MTITSATPGAGERYFDVAILWLKRAAGLALFALGVAYWIRLVGVFPGANQRFDLMSLPWRAAASMLAVLCPVAGVGLWLNASWGTVVWVLVVAVEIVMHIVLQRTFGAFGLEAAGLAAGLVALFALRLARWTARRRARANAPAG